MQSCPRLRFSLLGEDLCRDLYVQYFQRLLLRLCAYCALGLPVGLPRKTYSMCCGRCAEIPLGHDVGLLNVQAGTEGSGLAILDGVHYRGRRML